MAVRVPNTLAVEAIQSHKVTGIDNRSANEDTTLYERKAKNHGVTSQLVSALKVL